MTPTTTTTTSSRLPTSPTVSPGTPPPEQELLAPVQVQMATPHELGPPGARAVPLRNGGQLWVTGVAHVTSLQYSGDPQHLNLDQVQAVLEEVNTTAAQFAVPGEISRKSFTVDGGELQVEVALPDDAHGTPGAAPAGKFAADVAEMLAHKETAVSALLQEHMIPPLALLTINYAGLPMTGPDSELPIVPCALLASMPQTETASLGTRIYVPTADGAGGVQGTFIGFCPDDSGALVLFEAPPPESAGFAPDQMHPHPNGMSVIYKHPLPHPFWRDPEQPPRGHLVAPPSLDDLKAMVGKSVLLAPSSDEVGLPVILLGISLQQGTQPEQHLMVLQVRSNFHPENANPLDAWEDAWFENDVSAHKELPDGWHEWTLTFDPGPDGEDGSEILLDPLYGPPVADTGDADPLPAQAPGIKDVKGTPASTGTDRLGPGDFSDVAEDDPLRVNGTPVQFVGLAEPNEAPDAIWVTIARDADASGIGSLHSAPVTAPGPARMAHLVSYTASTVERDP